MIKSKEDLLSGFNEIIGENSDDNVLSFIEDISDTLDDLESKTNYTENWKTRYEENDRQWREKYKNRFMNNASEIDTDIDTDIEPDEEKKKPMTFEDLFK